MYEINCYDSYGNSINYLTQWDYNRKLIMYVYDYDLSVAPEVHFCNKNSEEALVVQSTVSDGNKITVDIPNILLQEPYSLFVYIYSTDSKNVSSQKTIVSVEIPIRKRLKPSEYSYVENIDKITSAQIEENIFNRIKDNLLMIKTAEQTTKAEESNGVNVYTITLTDGTTSNFEVRNGSTGKSAYEYAKDGGYNGTEEEFSNIIANIESDLEKIGGDITNLSNDVTQRINQAISEQTHFRFEKINTLPEIGEENVIYLVPNKQDSDNIYLEYLFVDGTPEIIGSTQIDLSGYVMKEEFNQLQTQIHSNEFILSKNKSITFVVGEEIEVGDKLRFTTPCIDGVPTAKYITYQKLLNGEIVDSMIPFPEYAGENLPINSELEFEITEDINSINVNNNVIVYISADVQIKQLKNKSNQLQTQIGDLSSLSLYGVNIVEILTKLINNVNLAPNETEA